jgi:hypothetical protein
VLLLWMSNFYSSSLNDRGCKWLFIIDYESSLKFIYSLWLSYGYGLFLNAICFICNSNDFFAKTYTSPKSTNVYTSPYIFLSLSTFEGSITTYWKWSVKWLLIKFSAYYIISSLVDSSKMISANVTYPHFTRLVLW